MRARLALDGAAPEEAGDGEAGEGKRNHDVFSDRHRQQAARALSIGRHERHSFANRGARVGRAQVLAIDRDAAAPFAKTEQRFAETILARVRQVKADPEDLAGADLEADLVETGGREVLHRQHDVGALRIGVEEPWLRAAQVATNHGADD